ncbi:GNAT family N-acetyltransferase [Saccharomonospora sp. NPDC046836]|uniref:GNAT family N-acetyltransferase n=1 Tax=Saccharomonospora sp. NPDC046836 TaxID=3156921 RepID=UPI003409C18F
MTDFLSRAGRELTAAELHDLLRLRVEVFIVEQECPYPEIDGKDLLPGTRHIWAPGPDGVAGCLRILAEPGGVQRIGRVCTAKSARGTGLGAQLMAAALDAVGDAECVLDAQTYAQGFYARFGFRPEGEEFDEDGIPHITMRRLAPGR